MMCTNLYGIALNFTLEILVNVLKFDDYISETR